MLVEYLRCCSRAWKAARARAPVVVDVRVGASLEKLVTEVHAAKDCAIPLDFSRTKRIASWICMEEAFDASAIGASLADAFQGPHKFPAFISGDVDDLLEARERVSLHMMSEDTASESHRKSTVRVDTAGLE